MILLMEKSLEILIFLKLPKAIKTTPNKSAQLSQIQKLKNKLIN